VEAIDWMDATTKSKITFNPRFSWIRLWITTVAKRPDAPSAAPGGSRSAAGS
jgi:hypothetical protein